MAGQGESIIMRGRGRGGFRVRGGERGLWELLLLDLDKVNQAGGKVE